MIKKVVYAPSVAIPVDAYSQAIDTGTLVFCSGQLAYDTQNDTIFPGSAGEQTEYLMKNIEAVLQAADLQFKDVAKTTIYLTNMNDFAAVNAVYARLELLRQVQQVLELLPLIQSVELGQIPLSQADMLVKKLFDNQATQVEKNNYRLSKLLSKTTCVRWFRRINLSCPKCKHSWQWTPR